LSTRTRGVTGSCDHIVVSFHSILSWRNVGAPWGIIIRNSLEISVFVFDGQDHEWIVSIVRVNRHFYKQRDTPLFHPFVIGVHRANITLTSNVRTRTAKQRREWWQNWLAPTLGRDVFQAWEHQTIIDRPKELGNHWALIAQGLSGRSPGALNNQRYAVLCALKKVQTKLFLSN
jgi:hypothetical protein